MKKNNFNIELFEDLEHLAMLLKDIATSYSSLCIATLAKIDLKNDLSSH